MAETMVERLLTYDAQQRPVVPLEASPVAAQVRLGVLPIGVDGQTVPASDLLRAVDAGEFDR